MVVGRGSLLIRRRATSLALLPEACLSQNSRSSKWTIIASAWGPFLVVLYFGSGRPAACAVHLTCLRYHVSRNQTTDALKDEVFLYLILAPTASVSINLWPRSNFSRLNTQDIPSCRLAYPALGKLIDRHFDGRNPRIDFVNKRYATNPDPLQAAV
jgi:hypothetical protein